MLASRDIGNYSKRLIASRASELEVKLAGAVGVLPNLSIDKEESSMSDGLEQPFNLAHASSLNNRKSMGSPSHIRSKQALVVE